MAKYVSTLHVGVKDNSLINSIASQVDEVVANGYKALIKKVKITNTNKEFNFKYNNGEVVAENLIVVRLYHNCAKPVELIKTIQKALSQDNKVINHTKKDLIKNLKK